TTSSGAAPTTSASCCWSDTRAVASPRPPRSTTTPGRCCCRSWCPTRCSGTVSRIPDGCIAPETPMNHRKRVVLAVLAASFLLPLGTAEARNRSYQPPVPFAIPLTDSGRGELQSVAAAPGGGFYAAGSVQSQGEGTFSVVVRITADGTLDPAFGNGGVAATPLQLGCTSEVDLAVQAGRPVVSATVPSPTDPLDCDIALVRLNQDGSIDAGFGEA